MDNENIEIRKARLGKNGTLEVSYVDFDCNEITLKGSRECHPDLFTALRALVPYFADLTEQREADRIDWTVLSSADNLELLHNLSVTGVTFSTSDAGKTVVVSGQRTLASSAVINISTHALELDTDGEWAYMPLFLLTLEAFLHECKEYIGGKCSAKQYEFDFDEAKA